ncbi:MAG: heme exporter protein CcmB [Rhodospirillales bacterium]|nr:heme exporter protein CcmB [Rhodospirillales bacterium]
MTAAAALVRRDLGLALRQGMDSLMAVLFFVLACVLFPLGVGPEPQMLARIASGIICVAALLAALLSLERLFQADYEDGSLEQIALSPLPLAVAVLAKVLAHWLTTGLPLIAVSPVLAVLLQLDLRALPVMIAALALATPSLSLIGAVGAALVLGARRGGVLLALLVLPLYIPLLIFAVSAIDAAIFGFAVRPHLMLLGGVLAGASVLAPVTAAAAARQALT